jgi:hypothetical protein
VCCSSRLHASLVHWQSTVDRTLEGTLTGSVRARACVCVAQAIVAASDLPLSVIIVGVGRAGEKTVFLSHVYIKMMILPTQARDKHRENSKKDRFPQTSG